jgi:hypothetical protein
MNGYATEDVLSLPNIDQLAAEADACCAVDDAKALLSLLHTPGSGSPAVRLHVSASSDFR